MGLPGMRARMERRGGRSRGGLAEPGVRDINGNLLVDGDSVIVIKDLKVKGSSSVVKGGTKVRNIRLTEATDGHNIACKIDGIGAMKFEIGVREEGVASVARMSRRVARMRAPNDERNCARAVLTGSAISGTGRNVVPDVAALIQATAHTSAATVPAKATKTRSRLFLQDR